MNNKLVAHLKRITLLFFVLFFCNHLVHSQERSKEIVLNFSKENSTKTAKNIHQVNYDGKGPFVMISAYSKDLNVGETLSFRTKTKGIWSKWIRLKEAHEGEDFDRIVFDPVFIETEFSHIQFDSNEVIDSEITFRLYMPENSTISKKKKGKPSTTNSKSNKAAGCLQPAYEKRLDWCPRGNCRKPNGSKINPTHIVIHHSAGNTTSNDFAAVVRGYWDFHVNTRGWSDIAYNWLIDPNGVIYEGRGNRTRGAHSPCMNGSSTGICLIGNYSTHKPNTTIIKATEKLIAWDASNKDIDVLASSYNTSLRKRIANVSGHRTAKDQYPSSRCTSTSCPGTHVASLLNTIQSNVSKMSCYSGEGEYCASQGNNSKYEWIKTVQIGDGRKTSSNDGGYSDTTDHTFTIERNKTTSILLEPGYRSTVYNENWKIWIDLNQDGDFEDAGEELFDNPGVSKNSVNGNLTIPVSATLGITRMRVGMNGSSADYTLNSCTVFSYGEVEDYLVNITANGSDNPKPVCDSKGTNSKFEWIAKVAINGQYHKSKNDGGYADYSNFTFNFSSNETYFIALYPDYKSTVYNENWKIWIDLNQDGDFTDEGEELYNNSAVASGVVEGAITIPPRIPNGNYRMRVSMNGSSSDYTLNPCKNFSYGEVEDYMVKIDNTNSSKKNLISTLEEIGISAYPNPVKEKLTVTSNEFIRTIIVYSSIGILVYQKEIKDEVNTLTIDASVWQQGLYILLIKTDTNQKVVKIIK